MRLMARSRLQVAAIAVPALLLATAFSHARSLAQQAPPQRIQPQARAPLPAPDADAGLQRRIEQLEEQLVDLQVTIGTLESLARGGVSGPPTGGPRAAPGPSAAVSAADAGRLDAIETQINALASQLEGLQQQVRALASRGGMNQPSGEGGPPPAFGSVTVAPDDRQDDNDRAPGFLQQGPPPRVAIAPPGGGQPEMPPQQLYEQAYGYLLQKDYASAQSGFEDFLSRHSGHQLAGNAQYWLGETFYVRGQYRPAAAAFLKGYQTYARSPKAPECLLKLAMSLNRLGQKDAACSSFNELASKYPNPPAHVKSIAQTERQRSGCS
jgi:tol-pal system protein YbgF